MHIYILIYIYEYVYIYTYINMYIYLLICMYIYKYNLLFCYYSYYDYIVYIYIHTYIYIYIFIYIYILYSFLHRNSIPLAYSFLTQFTFCRIQVKNTTSCRGWITIFAEAIEMCNPFISSQLIYTKSTIILCLHILSHTQHPPHVSKNIRAPWCYWYRLVSPLCWALGIWASCWATWSRCCESCWRTKSPRHGKRFAWRPRCTGTARCSAR